MHDGARSDRWGLALFALAALGGGASCLPGDTRPPPGSILFTVTSGDDPSAMSVDGWTIAVDRLVIGIGYASLGYQCTRYSDARYMRLLDGRLPTDQKLSILFGLGQCHFDFSVGAPSTDAVLGEGVSEADKELMAVPDGVRDPVGPFRPPLGYAVDFAATATRGPQIERIHWMLRQPTFYGQCGRALPGEDAQPIELRSDENLTFHIGIRGVALFEDDANPNTAVPRFDPIANADALHGNGDGEVTLDELNAVSLDEARQSGPGHYGVGSLTRGVPHSLMDYVYLVLLQRLVQFREDIACQTQIHGAGPS